jgi:DNA-binding XRE family transcriptional regulator
VWILLRSIIGNGIGASRGSLLPKIARFLGYNPSPTEPKQTISEAIKAYRLMHGWSQRKVAKTLGIDPTTLARWEKGKTAPGKKARNRLVDLLDCCDPLNSDG